MAESASEHNVLPENFSMRIQLQYMKFMLRAGFTRKKVVVLLDFVQITSPLSQFGQLVQLFERQKRRFKRHSK